MLVEEDIVVHHEESLLPDEFGERAGLEGDRVAGPRRQVVAPGLAGIHRAGAAHPVVDRRAGEHQQDVDSGRRDEAAMDAASRVFLVEIKRVDIVDGAAIALNRLEGEMVGDGLALLTRHDLVPDLALRGVFPEIGLDGRLHAFARGLGWTAAAVYSKIAAHEDLEDLARGAHGAGAGAAGLARLLCARRDG